MLRKAAETLGPNHPNVAQALNNLAALYLYQDRYVDAEPLFKRALAAFEKTLGPSHPEIVNVMDNLANLYKAQDRLAEAEQITRRSTAIREGGRSRSAIAGVGNQTTVKTLTRYENGQSHPPAGRYRGACRGEHG
ncbi:MAG: tetratricopeptide repeat protein [Bradyrhizobium sp.]|nr:tetratricopeptide repeat protein [Bradyrhizobium sp.]